MSLNFKSKCYTWHTCHGVYIGWVNFVNSLWVLPEANFLQYSHTYFGTVGTSNTFNDGGGIGPIKIMKFPCKTQDKKWKLHRIYALIIFSINTRIITVKPFVFMKIKFLWCRITHELKSLKIARETKHHLFCHEIK